MQMDQMLLSGRGEYEILEEAAGNENPRENPNYVCMNGAMHVCMYIYMYRRTYVCTYVIVNECLVCIVRIDDIDMQESM